MPMSKNITVVCAWYEMGMRHYSINILKILCEVEFSEYNIDVVLVLRKPKEAYDELKDYNFNSLTCLVLDNNIVNIASKIFPSVFDFFLLKYIKNKKSDLVYILFGGLFFKQLKRITKRVPVLATVHDLVPHEKQLSTIKDWILSKIENKRDGFLFKNSNYLVTNSEQQYEQLKADGRDVFYTPMPSLVSDEIARGSMQVQELINEKNYILFFGRIDKYKGVDNLINCFINSSVSRDHKMVIAGTGDIYFDKPVSENLIFINRFIDDSELFDLFSNARLCCLPYISATQTSLVSLPFYFECPVVYSNIIGFQDIVEKTNSIAVNFKDIDDFEYKINGLSNLRLNDIVTQQNNYYKKHFSRAKLKKSILSIFEELC